MDRNGSKDILDCSPGMMVLNTPNEKSENGEKRCQ